MSNPRTERETGDSQADAPPLLPPYSVDPETHRIEFSLKTEPGSGKKSQKEAQARREAQSGENLRLQDLEAGQKVDGFIRALAEFGVFVQIEGTRISGLAHRSEVSRMYDHVCAVVGNLYLTGVTSFSISCLTPRLQTLSRL